MQGAIYKKWVEFVAPTCSLHKDIEITDDERIKLVTAKEPLIKGLCLSQNCEKFLQTVCIRCQHLATHNHDNHMFQNLQKCMIDLETANSLRFEQEIDYRLKLLEMKSLFEKLQSKLSEAIENISRSIEQIYQKVNFANNPTIIVSKADSVASGSTKANKARYSELVRDCLTEIYSCDWKADESTNQIVERAQKEKQLRNALLKLKDYVQVNTDADNANQPFLTVSPDTEFLQRNMISEKYWKRLNNLKEKLQQMVDDSIHETAMFLKDGQQNAEEVLKAADDFDQLKRAPHGMMLMRDISAPSQKIIEHFRGTIFEGTTQETPQILLSVKKYGRGAHTLRIKLEKLNFTGAVKRTNGIYVGIIRDATANSTPLPYSLRSDNCFYKCLFNENQQNQMKCNRSPDTAHYESDAMGSILKENDILQLVLDIENNKFQVISPNAQVVYTSHTEAALQIKGYTWRFFLAFVGCKHIIRVINQK